MNLRVLFAIPLVVLLACSGTEPSGPSVDQPTALPVISDGAHPNIGDPGNPDFFFLPPIVLPTGPLTNWTPNGFHSGLAPTVEYCLLNQTNRALVTPATGCVGSPVIIPGSDVKKHFRTGEPSTLPSNFEDLVSHYHAEFPVTGTCGIYRVWVKHVTEDGNEVLGYADVQCVKKVIELFTFRDYKKFGAVLHKTILQIPFRIEQFALCSNPGVGPCVFALVDPGAAGPTTVFAPTPEGAPLAGVTFPGGDTGTPPLTLTIETCAGLGIPGQLGSCFTINSSLGDAELGALATVFICDILAPTADLPPELQHRIHMHRKHNGDVTVLEGAPAPLCEAPEPVGFSVRGLFGALAHRDWKTARQQVFGLLAPKPLYARRRLNLGIGGRTIGFSDFQNAEDRSIPIVDYGSLGWSYQIDGAPPGDWFSSGASPFSLSGIAPFGSPDQVGCTLNQALNFEGGLATSWPAGDGETTTDLYVRRTFQLLAPATVRIGIAIDNDFQLYVDGMERTDGLEVHDGCPTLDSYTFDINLAAGSHVVAIRGHDRGTSSYLDAKVTFNLTN